MKSSKSRNRKKAIAGLFIAPVVIGSISHAVISNADYTEMNPLHITVDNSTKEFKDGIILKDGESFVSLSTISKKLGAKIEWKNDTEELLASQGENQLRAQLDSNHVYINREKVKLKNAIFLKDGKVMVPLSVVAGWLNVEIETNSKNKTSEIKIEEENKEYIVQNGDTLWRIGLKHNISVANIIETNNLDSDKIVVGQKLVLKEADKKNNLKTVKKDADNTYTVVAGDSLWSIASKNGVSVDDLMIANNLQSDVLHPGDKLAIKKSVTENIEHKGYHEVTSGETLDSIAKSYGITVEQLKEANGLVTDVLYEGRILNVNVKKNKEGIEQYKSLNGLTNAN